MGAYNCANTIDDAVISIVSQSFKDWELIVCDDASTDDTPQKLAAWALRDPRIHVIKNASNLGLAKVLDRCIAASRCELLIRHDADDISVHNRFARLTDAMTEHPDATVIGSWMTCFDDTGDIGVIRALPLPTKTDLLDGTVFCHPTCAMRKAQIVSVGGYGNSPWLRRSQDYYLWFRLYAAGFHGINIQETLYKFREDRQARLRRGWSTRWMESRVRWEGFKLIDAPYWQRPFAFTPLLKCLVPSSIYSLVKKVRLARGG